MLAYGSSMIELYAVSAVYHLGSWHGRRRGIVRALDHANIFILIAGTYTPFCVNVLSGWLRPAMRVRFLVFTWPPPPGSGRARLRAGRRPRRC